MTESALMRAEQLVDREPDRLFVLTAPSGDLELYETPGGELAVWAYRDIRDLVTSCGGGQPWMRASAVELATTARAVGVPILVALDVGHPDGARYPEPDACHREPLPQLRPAAAPPRVWIPTRPPRDGVRQVQVELHAARRGEPMLPVYSTVASLRAGCGPHQAAVAVRPEDIAGIVRAVGARGVAADAVLAERARHQAPVVTWTGNNRSGGARDYGHD
ncbi:SAV_915 family protein [Amycolatopsis antarctica]|uniref:SAV_915 family protein n=1 Tax=Amycolatopsis antarctica TaxID=1854586 RepID=UPI001056CA7A|nr:SAV_915 family protein [Amycolatopsis antarctica]